jgi:hypothetical protein
MQITRHILFAAAMAATVFATGCESLKAPKTVPWSETATWAETVPWLVEEENPIEPAAKMVALWTDTVYYQAGETPTRGFGGRIYFYNRKNSPVRVAGSLAVYAFDDTNGESSRETPDRKFVFTSEEFERHFSPCELGSSYSFWLPWDAAGGTQKELSLVPIFTSEDGAVVVGQQSRHVLPGKDSIAKPSKRLQRPTGPTDGETTQDWAVQPASYVATDSSIGEDLRFRMQTATINVPPSVGQRWSAHGTREFEQEEELQRGVTGTTSAHPATQEPSPASRPRYSAEAARRFPANPPSTRSESLTRPAPRAPFGRQGLDHAPRQPSRSVRPFDHPSSPKSARGTEPAEFLPDVAQPLQ